MQKEFKKLIEIDILTKAWDWKMDDAISHPITTCTYAEKNYVWIKRMCPLWHSKNY